MHELVHGVLEGNKRSTARLITLIEDNQPNKNEILSQLFPHTGKAYILGITGSPGAGKSSLVDSITREIRKQGLTVGIIAVDPSSPFTGGALLGDRIRMQEHATDAGVFIRSMGSRGSLGGLARTTKDVIRVFDAYGCDIVIVETVGVGQSELDIINVADTTLVVLTPGAGDSIQTIKAGIMEIADVFVVNKGDLPGADKVMNEVESMLDLVCHHGWRPPISKCSNIKHTGIDELLENLNKHRKYIEENGLLEKERDKRFKHEVLELLEISLRERIHQKVVQTENMANIVNQVGQHQLAPYLAAEKILNLGLDLNDEGSC